MPVRSISAIIALAGVLVAGAPAASLDAASDIRNLVVELEQRHPDPYHEVSREVFHRAAEDVAGRAGAQRREETIVAVMRLLALLGERDGHSGIHPLSPVPGQTLRAYPLRLYRFPEGLFVVRARDSTLVGARVTAIGGLPIEEVEARVRPLITRDNEWTVLDRLPYFVVVAEVLSGLGIAPSFTFQLPRDGTREVTLSSISVAEHVRLFGGWWQATTRPGRQPLYLRLRNIQYGLTKIDRGRALYVTYNATTDPGLVPQRLVRFARNRRVRRVIVDIRLNGGGNSATYRGLIQALRHPRINRPERLCILIGRRTFSAAGNFAGDVDRRTRARFFGEPTGGAPSQWGDSAPIELPSLGLVASTAVEYIGYPGDTRLATYPDIPVATSAADFFAGRDPVLAAALR
jgi:Peptidase family S41